MKTHFLSLVLVVVFVVLADILQAQNYQNVCSPGVTLYRDSADALKGFRYDTLQVLAGEDSIFLTFYTFRKIKNQDWFDTTGGTILGRKIIKNHNGWLLFFNNNGDTIRMNSLAGLNGTWKMFDLPGKSFIQARISTVLMDSVMDGMDSIKIIVLQSYDSLGNPIQHPVNAIVFKLSKHYGLSQISDLWVFPDISVKFTLCGKTHPKTGIQPLTTKDVYDFNVGDEFHYSLHYQSLDYHGSQLDSRRIRTILSKTISQDSLSITYTICECYKSSYYTFPYNSGTTSGRITDTITYNFVALENQYFFNKLPDEFFILNPGENTHYSNKNSSRIVYNSGIRRIEKIIQSRYYANDPGTDHQWVLFSTAFPNIYRDMWKSFANGLGEVSVIDHRMYGYKDDAFLVYFKKGDEIYGNPVAKDCSSLIGKEENDSDQQVIEIWPNPVISEASVKLSGFNLDDGLNCILYDCSGREVKKTQILSNSFIINRYGLSSGLYFLTIRDRNGVIKGKNKMVID